MSKSWLNPKVEIRVSALGEERLFAVQTIKPDEQITRRGDSKVLMMTNDEFREFAKTAGDYDALAITGGFKKVSLSDPHDATQFAGRSKTPNAHNDGDGLLALVEITPGEEITV